MADGSSRSMVKWCTTNPEMFSRGRSPSSSRRVAWVAVWVVCAVAQAGCEQRPAARVGESASSHRSDPIVESRPATWTCTGSPCPWGASLTNHAIAWPAAMQPVASRLGYTVSAPVYAPADRANGVTVSIAAGKASVHVGKLSEPSHRLLATVSAGRSFQVLDLAADEVMSVQSDASFGYRLTLPEHPIPPRAASAPAPEPPAPGPVSASQATTWTCTGERCPWGKSLSSHTVVWPAAAGASHKRLDYTASAAVYLPAGRANGATISIASGAARAYAGEPGSEPYRLLAELAAGQTLRVTGLAEDEVLSVQAGEPFTYRITLPPRREPAPRPDRASAPEPAAPPGAVIRSTRALWRCNHTPGCFSDAWTGAVIPWPAWSAHQSNGRTGNVLRYVYSTRGKPLYPYMGAWAEGCTITAESGAVAVVEWQRGASEWRQTKLQPRESHVIHLVPPEDGALIESPEGTQEFSVSLQNCTPQRIQP